MIVWIAVTVVGGIGAVIAACWFVKQADRKSREAVRRWLINQPRAPREVTRPTTRTGTIF